MNKFVKIVLVLVIAALFLGACGNTTKQETRIASLETSRGTDEANIAALTAQVNDLKATVDPVSPTSPLTCRSAPEFLRTIDLDKYAKIVLPRFTTEEAFVLSIFPVQVAYDSQSADGAHYYDATLKNLPWFVAMGPKPSLWLTGGGKYGVGDTIPTALIFPVPLDTTNKVAIELEFSQADTVFMTYGNDNLDSAISWLKSCGIDEKEIQFFGGNYLKPTEFLDISAILPSISPVK